VTRRSTRLRRLGPRAAVAAALLLAAGAALARAGGGHGYSGGSSHGGGSSGGGGGDGGGLVFLLFQLLFEYPALGVPLLVIVVVGYVVTHRRTNAGEPFSTSSADALGQAASAHPPVRAGLGGDQVEALRAEDPDFSEPLFLDFAAALVARAVGAAGTARLASVDRYLAGPETLAPFAPGGWQNVVVGSTQLRSVSLGPDATRLVVDAAIGASSAAGGRWWRTAWTFTRRRGVRSKGPGEITRLACPSCGSAAERTPDGACSHCGQQPAPGEAAWAAAEVAVLAAEPRPPVALGGYAEERGTELPTVRSPALPAALAALPQRLPGFEPEQAAARFSEVFLALQRAWSEGDLPALRLLTTDSVFAGWRYWIEAYRAAGLKNRLTQVQVLRIEPARISVDRYYVAITVRIFASMVDQTVDGKGKVVDGRASPRPFSEYWTFVRTLSAATPEVTCPGCGASLPAGQAGQCPYCGSLVGAPAFDWILSRVDQDEDYHGG
jgi:predicted lipid-binding transport protein (Tim44 family)